MGDAAQHTYSLTFKYKPVRGLSINATYYVADQLYAPYNIFEDQYPEVALTQNQVTL